MTASIRLTNSGENRFRTLESAMLSSLLDQIRRADGSRMIETDLRPHLIEHFPRAEIARQENQRLLEVDDGVVAEVQDGLVEHAQQQRRQGRRRFLDLVEQHQREVAVAADDGLETLLRQQRLRLAMADVPGRRANQLGHFVVRLVLGAIDLEQMLGAAVQNFGERFDRPRLARSRSGPAAGRRPPADRAH